MTEITRSIILGIIQGLTEFLPVSSSGHLELAKYFLGDTSLSEESLMMTVVVHFGTAMSTVVIFRKEILQILQGLFRFEWNEETRFAWLIVISMMPAAIIGVLWEDELDALFYRQIVLVCICLLITGLLLVIANSSKNSGRPLNPFRAAVIGIAQAIAILPGISRSGATISTSILLGLDREMAARFSFLMVLPLIFGKIAKDFFTGDINAETPNIMPLISAFAGAFFTGLLACKWMIQLVKASKLVYFSIYCITLAIVALIVYIL
jgi:undecaprenyl-diphosphatase